MKAKKLVVSLILLLSCTFIFVGCNNDYIFHAFKSGNITGGYCKHTAFIGECTGDVNNTVIELPDEYKGKPVTSLGGQIGWLGTDKPFEIILPDKDYTYKESNNYTYIEGTKVYDDDYETITFTIKIGKNLKGVEWISDEIFIGYRTTDKDGNMHVDVIYKIEYYFVVDSQNEYCYSKDGRIYARNSDCLLG